MKVKTILLGAVMITALVAGVWLLVSPSIDRHEDLGQQEELLDAVMAAIADAEAETPACEPQECDDMETVTETAIDFQYSDYEPDEPIAQPLEPLVPLDASDFPSGIVPIGILTVESINLQLPVMEGIGEPELRIAPGRIPQTAHVGENGNAVIIGHRNYTYGSMFNRLGEMEIGDIVQFQAMSGEIMDFVVFEILIITPDDQIAFIQPQDESIITLYTCTPIREATHRLLVRARIIEGGI